MPRLPINYANTIMYKIYKPDETDADNIYIGHTTDFSCRKTTHKSNCNNPKSACYNSKKYEYIRASGGWECFKMIQIEEYFCKNRREAEAREEELRIELKAKLNTNRAFSTPENKKENKRQYKKEHAEERKEYERQYRKNHAEQKKEYQRLYRLKKKQEKLALTIEPVIT